MKAFVPRKERVDNFSEAATVSNALLDVLEELKDVERIFGKLGLRENLEAAQDRALRLSLRLSERL